MPCGEKGDGHGEGKTGDESEGPGEVTRGGGGTAQEEIGGGGERDEQGGLEGAVEQECRGHFILLVCGLVR